ncbi:hypothetical protein BN129_2103 [Cronobacter sakazakii 701]|nr:hypothetical protein BN129_2103 [Cronobacter sakazakii 701]
MKPTVIGAGGDERHLRVALAGAQMTTTHFFLKQIPAVFQGMVNAFFADVFDTHRQPGFGGGDIGDPAAHEPAAQYTDRVQRARGGLAAGLFFKLGGGEEQPSQRGGFRRHRQFAKGAGLGLITAGAALLKAGAHHVNNALRRRIVTVGFLMRFLGHHAKQQRAANRACEQTLANRQTARRGTVLFRQFGSGFQQNRLRHHIIHQPGFQRLTRPQLFARKDHLKRGADANEARQPLRAAGARQQPKLHFRQPEQRFHIIGTDAAVAGKRQLQPAAEARAMNSRHHMHRQRVDLRHDLLALACQRFGLLRALAVGDHVDIRTGDKVIRLGGDKYHAREIAVFPQRFDNRADVAGKLRLQRVHFLARHVDGDHRNIVRAHL